MTYKIREIETNKELIVHYDRMKPCRSPPGGFVPPVNTPSAPKQPPNQLASNSTPAKCHSSFCEAPITCTSSVDPVSVSSLVPIIQPAPPPTLRCHQLPTTTLPSPLRRWRKKLSQTVHLIPPCLIAFIFLKSLIPQIVPSTLLFPPRPFVMTHLWSSTPSFLLAGPFPPQILQHQPKPSRNGHFKLTLSLIMHLRS